MGKLVSFWSPYAGHGKVTSSLCAVLGGFMLRYPELSMAVSYIQKESVTLLKKLDNDAAFWNDKGWLDMFGVDTLKMYERQNTVRLDSIRRCGLSISGKKLYFYPNSSWNEKEDTLTFKILTEQLKKEFDIVFLDLESGKKSKSLQYMAESDYVVIVLPQDPMYVDIFWQEQEAYLRDTNYGIVFGGCFLKSQYRSIYYKRLYGKKMNNKILGEIPWNADFFNAMSVGKTMDFFFRNYAPVKKEENYEFIMQVKKTTERLQKNIICS